MESFLELAWEKNRVINMNDTNWDYWEAILEGMIDEQNR